MDEKMLKSMYDNMQANTEALKALYSKEQMHQKNTPANFGTFTELHGNGSLFGSFPIERDVITAHIRPLGGIVQVLQRLPTTEENPIFASITGFTATTGNEPTYPCSDAPAGFMKGCNLTAMFGRYARDTQTIEMDKVFKTFNRGDFRDLVLRGQLLSGGPLSPVTSQTDALNVVTKSEMIIAGVNLERLLTNQVWQGNPANSNAGGGYIEFPGLDRQIATGQVDAHTNVACPALDSDVKNFGYQNVCGTVLDIVEYLSALEYYLRFNADHMGLTPVQWVIVMRPQLWEELSACWPCRYLTNRCSSLVAGQTTVGVINDTSNIDMRNAMRAGMYIDINGVRYPVITDMGIFEHNNVNNANLRAGQYASTIYMVPLTITGGFPVTYFEYADYRQAQADVALLNGTEHFWWTDSGMYSWAVEYVKWCFKLSVKVEPRIVLRTPQLAGRIDAVMYTPLQHSREFDPASSYFADGGVSLRANQRYYAVWGGTRI
jgi:hypothetical protein